MSSFKIEDFYPPTSDTFLGTFEFADFTLNRSYINYFNENQ